MTGGVMKKHKNPGKENHETLWVNPIANWFFRIQQFRVDAIANNDRKKIEESLRRNNPSQQFSLNMKVRMNRLGISQAKLSELTGLPRSTIARVYHAKRSPSLDIAHKIAEGLSTTVSYLMNDENRLLKRTGIQYIDKAIEEVIFYLLKGSQIYDKVKDYFDDDYRLHYADIDLYNPDRIGPDIIQELKLNDKGLKSKMTTGFDTYPYIRSACIVEDWVHIHIRVITEQNKNWTTQLPIATMKDRQSHAVDIIDMWKINRNLLNESEAERANKNFKILARYIKVLSQSQA